MCEAAHKLEGGKGVGWGGGGGGGGSGGWRGLSFNDSARSGRGARAGGVVPSKQALLRARSSLRHASRHSPKPTPRNIQLILSRTQTNTKQSNVFQLSFPFCLERSIYSCSFFASLLLCFAF
jgi:hypothetical protein